MQELQQRDGGMKHEIDDDSKSHRTVQYQTSLNVLYYYTTIPYPHQFLYSIYSIVGGPFGWLIYFPGLDSVQVNPQVTIQSGCNHMTYL